MKYTILGFSQQHLLNLGLGMDEAMILRWFVDFQGTGRMRPVIHGGKTWLWVNYGGVLEDLPIVGGSAKTISRRFEKLADAGVLEHITIKEGGVFSCFRLCEAVYSRLVDSQDPQREQEQPSKEEIDGLDNSVQPKTELSDPWTNLSEQKTLLQDTITPLENINILFPPTGENPPKKPPKTPKRPQFVKPTLDEVDAYCQEQGGKVNPEKWFSHYEANGWKVGRNPMKDWKAAVRTWEHGNFDKKPDDKFRSGRVNELWAGKKSGKVTL